MVVDATFIREFLTVDPDIRRSWGNPDRSWALLLVQYTGAGEGRHSLLV